MADVTVYTRSFCPYCTRAISLLQRKGANVREIDATGCPEKRQEMIDKSGQMGVPVIFVGDEMIIGFDKKRLTETLGLPA